MVREYGFLDMWQLMYGTDASKCGNGDPDFIKRKQNRLSSLKLINLTGAMTVVVVGWILSFAVFLIERASSAGRRRSNL